ERRLPAYGPDRRRRLREAQETGGKPEGSRLRSRPGGDRRRGSREISLVGLACHPHPWRGGRRVVTTFVKAPVDGTVNFIQHHLPSLEPGAYMATVSQTVSTQTDPLKNTYFFAVQGPRFALNPSDVFATWPPDMAEGEFDNTLPHVVLTNQTLPWLRNPT